MEAPDDDLNTTRVVMEVIERIVPLGGTVDRSAVAARMDSASRSDEQDEPTVVSELLIRTADSLMPRASAWSASD